MQAIAGLHTAAVSGFVFFALRFGIAAWPWLALRVSGKRVAALGGLIAVICYLVLSGAHPPARRAAITASVAFIAILCDGKRCAPLQGTEPALAAWWRRCAPKPDQFAALCSGAAIVVMRATVDAPTDCGKALVLTPRDFIAGGAAEVSREPRGWRVAWAQPFRGQRPWTEIQW